MRRPCSACEIDPKRSILVPTAHDEPAIRLGIYREMFAKPAAVAFNTEVEKNFLKTTFEFRAVAEETVGCGVDLLQDAAQADDPEPEDDEELHKRLDPHLRARGAQFRRRHRLQGQFLLYGGRIDAGKGCEELIEYFTAYKEQGGEAALTLMGVKLMQLPEVPWVRFAGLAVGARTPAGARGRDHRRRAVAVREPVAAGARGDGGRHAGAVQRAVRSAGRPLREEQRRAVLFEQRRVHRVHQAAAGRRAPARADGPQRQGIHQAQLSLGRHHVEVRQADWVVARAHDCSAVDCARRLSRPRPVRTAAAVVAGGDAARAGDRSSVRSTNGRRSRGRASAVIAGSDPARRRDRARMPSRRSASAATLAAANCSGLRSRPGRSAAAIADHPRRVRARSATAPATCTGGDPCRESNGARRLQVVRGLWSTAGIGDEVVEIFARHAVGIVDVRRVRKRRATALGALRRSDDDDRSDRSNGSSNRSASSSRPHRPTSWRRCRMPAPRRCCRISPSGRTRGWLKTAARRSRRWATNSAPAPTC